MINLWDARHTKKPLHTLEGHCHPSVRRGKSIYHPKFIHSGKGVLTTGTGRSTVSLYNTETGALSSMGEVEYEMSCLTVAEPQQLQKQSSASVNNPMNSQVAMAHGKYIELFQTCCTATNT